MRWLGLVCGGFVVLAVGSSDAAVAVSRTRFEVPSSNGHGAILVDLDDARRITQLREHVFAAEEPELDANGAEIWNGSGFAAVYTRDVLYDAYFGLRGPDGATWLPSIAADLDASGYIGIDGDASDVTGGTGIVAIAQTWGDLHATTYAFAPVDLAHTGFVMILHVRNDGDVAAGGVQAFSLHNFHLGFGRPGSPWDVGQDLGSNGETLVRTAADRFDERGFAGSIVARALDPVSHWAAGPGQDPYAIVQGGGDLPDNAPSPNAVDDALSAWQFDLGTLDPGEETWVGVAFVHHGDPFGADEAAAWLDGWIAGRNAQSVIADERNAWAQWHGDVVTAPAGLDAYEESALRQAAAMLRMGQVRENSAYLREWLDEDGAPRRTRFPSVEAPATLPGRVDHRGHGAVLASLPPGNWTFAWVRDGSYAAAAMAELGMTDEARDALAFYLDAEGGRFADWTELADYDMPPYLVTLVRYLGFGVEETDFNEFGPNLEFDGFGLFLWALGAYVDASDDVAFVEDHWPAISELVGDPIVALVDPSTGLLRADSSIWETHWNGRERQWTYTNITAVRGLCDASELAELVGDDARAASYREAALALREAIATQLVDASGVLASNAEELASGSGYHDAAVLDAFAMGLFDPNGDIASATLAAFDEHLLAEAGEVGWSRNDDRWDHAAGEDLSPWGSNYDSAEWVVTDLRGAIVLAERGEARRADALLSWVTAQTTLNYLMFAETYDETTGEYKFNAPMLGFGAGAYALALAHRGGVAVDPACGEYWDAEGGTDSDGGSADTSGSGGDGDDETGSASADGTTEGSASMGTASSTNDSGGSDGAGLDDGDICPQGSDCEDSCSCSSSPRPDARAVWLGSLLLLVRRRRRAALLAASIGLAACGDDGAVRDDDGDSGDEDVMTTIPVTQSDTSPDTGDATSDPDDTGPTDDGSDSGTTGDVEPGEEVDVCPTPFAFEPTGSVTAVRIAGEWQDFDPTTASALEETTPGVYTTSIDLAPGLHAYKLVVDDASGTQWILDPTQARRKYVDETENSAVLVRDCNLPSLSVDTSTIERTAPGQGSFTATLVYEDGAPGDGPDPDAYTAVLRHAFEERELGGDEIAIDPATGDVELTLGDLDDGKYTIVVTAVDRFARASEPLRLPIWIEAEPFDWRDAVVYMVMTDRYRNGDADNDPAPTPSADDRGDFQGGDLEGLRQSIADGVLDELGVRAIWLSPFQTNPDLAYLASDGAHFVTGYHGYWPTRAREVDDRLGGEAALRAMVAEAHAHGIRVLQDYVINHVHEDHEYVAEHPDWFRTGCVCGTNGCDWTANALECTFTDYMPDIDHRVPEANAALVDDAVWWLDAFDLDGLRVDAVKHVEESATRNLAVAVREGFEAAGTRYFLMGETAMGWNDCPDPCNDENYDTISRYVGPYGLDGQFDFVLYHGVSYRTFAYGDNGMLHADYWFAHNMTKWPEGSVMTPYIGSHDTPRFVSLADYRGQDGGHPRYIANNQWNDIAVEPGDDEPYRRARIAFSWLLGLPGAPLMYYGDEYGQWGGADPNNRLMWRPQSELNARESETLAWIRQLGTARQDIVALRRGDYVSLGATEDSLAFGRLVAPGEAAIVALTRSTNPVELDVNVVQLGWNPGTELHDALGGPDVTVAAGGQLSIDLPASGAVILTP